MTVRTTNDPVAFKELVLPFLQGDPVRNSTRRGLFADRPRQSALTSRAPAARVETVADLRRFQLSSVDSPGARPAYGRSSEFRKRENML